MLRRIGLVPVIAAAAIFLVGCDPKPAEAPANDSAPAVTEVNDSAPSDANASNMAAGTGAGAATGEACGGIVPITCSSPKDYCKIPDGQCGTTADPMGTCKARPDICTEHQDPVCGCDGNTYGNACKAARAGVSVQSKGECAKPAA
jgi:hypothetical protein